MKSQKKQSTEKQIHFTLTSIAHWLKVKRRRGVKVVATNGCFDLLHYGHVQYLERARKLGNLLVVGLNSDTSVRRLKGQGRPLVSQKYRAAVLNALRAVDAVVIFPQTLAAEFLRVVKPDIYVKGGDYHPAKLNPKELAVLKENHTKIRILSFAKGFSTTSIVRKIQGMKMIDL